MVKGIYASTFLPVFVAALLHHDPLRWSAAVGRGNQRKSKAIEIAIACVLFALPPHSVLSFWRLGTHLVSHSWPDLFHSVVPTWIIHGGPLGYGCTKVCEVVVGCLLWSIVAAKADDGKVSSSVAPFRMGPWPSFQAWLAIVFLATVVNGVLSLWSYYSQSRGDHEGVRTVVESSVGRELTWNERMKLAGLAIVNAICEELVSRGLWRTELQIRGKLSLHYSNLAQAMLFGVWHYHGIPSGWTGVCLTFVYGCFMGILQDYGEGLLLPIAAHSLADYFIFAVIARKTKA